MTEDLKMALEYIRAQAKEENIRFTHRANSGKLPRAPQRSLLFAQRRFQKESPSAYSVYNNTVDPYHYYGI